MPKEVKVVINPDGSITLDFNGWADNRCLKAGSDIKAVLAGLGINSLQTSFTPKPELIIEATTDEYTPNQTQARIMEGQ